MTETIAAPSVTETSSQWQKVTNMGLADMPVLVDQINPTRSYRPRHMTLTWRSSCGKHWWLYQVVLQGPMMVKKGKTTTEGKTNVVNHWTNWGPDDDGYIDVEEGVPEFVFHLAASQAPNPEAARWLREHGGGVEKLQPGQTVNLQIDPVDGDEYGEPYTRIATLVERINVDGMSLANFTTPMPNGPDVSWQAWVYKGRWCYGARPIRVLDVLSTDTVNHTEQEDKP